MERSATNTASNVSANAVLSAGGAFWLNVAPVGTGLYAVDIGTGSGFRNLVSGLDPDGSGNVSIPENALVPGTTNFLRVRKDTGEPEAYSAPLTIAYDPTVTPTSSNQIRSLSIGRVGTNVVLRWAVLTANNKKTRVYFTGANGGMIPLTPGGLSPSVRALTIPDQALATPRGVFHLTQVDASGAESPASVGACLPPPTGYLDLGPGNECGGGEDPPPPPSPNPPPTFADAYLHRDHLGSLRVVTDAAVDYGDDLE